jgi:hypothetical protein
MVGAIDAIYGATKQGFRMTDGSVVVICAMEIMRVPAMRRGKSDTSIAI